MDELTEYERLRQIRIAENKEKMQSLGLIETLREARHLESHRNVRPKSSCTSQRANPAATVPGRRSTRQQSIKTEVIGLELGEVSELQGRRVACFSRGTDDDHDLHNAYRLKTMSDKSLRVRIRNIRNVAKMQSFVRVLRDQDMGHLLEEAEEALRCLLGQE